MYSTISQETLTLSRVSQIRVHDWEQSKDSRIKPYIWQSKTKFKSRSDIGFIEMPIVDEYSFGVRNGYDSSIAIVYDLGRIICDTFSYSIRQSSTDQDQSSKRFQTGIRSKLAWGCSHRTECRRASFLEYQWDTTHVILILKNFTSFLTSYTAPDQGGDLYEISSIECYRCQFTYHWDDLSTLLRLWVQQIAQRRWC